MHKNWVFKSLESFNLPYLILNETAALRENNMEEINERGLSHAKVSFVLIERYVFLKDKPVKKVANLFFGSTTITSNNLVL